MQFSLHHPSTPQHLDAGRPNEEKQQRASAAELVAPVQRGGIAERQGLEGGSSLMTSQQSVYDETAGADTQEYFNMDMMGIIAPKICVALYGAHACLAAVWFILCIFRWDVFFLIFFKPTPQLPNANCSMVYGVEDLAECAESVETWHFILFGAWSGGFSVTITAYALWATCPVLMNALRKGLLVFSVLFLLLLCDLEYPMLRSPSTGVHALTPDVNHVYVGIFLALHACFTVAVGITRPKAAPTATISIQLQDPAAERFRALCFLDALCIGAVVVWSVMAVEFLIDFTHDTPVLSLLPSALR